MESVKRHKGCRGAGCEQCAKYDADPEGFAPRWVAIGGTHTPRPGVRATLPMRLPSASLPKECVHRGEVVRLADCTVCGGKSAKAKVQSCALHGECTQFTRPIQDVRACMLCKDRSPPPGKKSAVVHMNAEGMGDALLGLAATRGLQKAGREVEYRVHPDAIPFVKLFTGWDSLGEHVFDATRSGPPDGCDFELNTGYNDEVVTRAALPRWTRYCFNAGMAEPTLPELRDRRRLAAGGRKYAGCVALFPFSTWTDRLWRVESWRTTVRMLRDAGHRVVVLDVKEERCRQLDAEYVAGASAEEVAAVMLNARCVVGVDSGPAHLAGMMGVPTIVLTGRTAFAPVFGLYASARNIRGVLDCDGCWSQTPFDQTQCNATCASMGTIRPVDVLDAVAATPDNGRRLDRLKGTVPFGVFDAAQAVRQKEHLDGDDWLYEPGKKRHVCGILGALHQELAEQRPDLADLVLEATWMARMMNDRGVSQHDLDWASERPDGHVTPESPAGGMKYALYFPHVANRDLLDRALASVQRVRRRVVVIDNSPEGLGVPGVRVLRPPVPLTHVQSMNLMQKDAKALGLDAALYMHTDAYFTDQEAIEDFVRYVAEQKDRWGVLFTLYDSCCAFSRAAMEEVGAWDAAFQFYTADSDWYRRVRLAGFATRDCEAVHPRIVHEGSMTAKRDPVFALACRFNNDYARKYYERKWGGIDGGERFTEPFDGRTPDPLA